MGGPILTNIIPLIVLGGTTGVVYTLFSEGFSLMYGVGGILNGAYGALYMLTDYFVFTFLAYYGVGILPSIVIALGAVFLVGLGVQKLVESRAKSQLESLFITLGLAFVLQYLVGFLQCSTLFSSNCQRPPYVPVFIHGSTSLAGVSVANQILAADLVSVVFLVGMWLMLNKLKLGFAIRAVSQDRKASELVGIDNARTMLVASGLATVMAGTSSIFLASYQTVDPTIGWSIITLAFAIVILGGLGSLKGTLLASFVLSYAQTAVLLFFNPILTSFVSLALLIVVLLVRPEGIFGKELKFYERLEGA